MVGDITQGSIVLYLIVFIQVSLTSLMISPKVVNDQSR